MIAAPLCSEHMLNTILRELRERHEIHLHYDMEAKPCSFCRNMTHDVADVEYISKNVLSGEKQG